MPKIRSVREQYRLLRQSEEFFISSNAGTCRPVQAEKAGLNSHRSVMFVRGETSIAGLFSKSGTSSGRIAEPLALGNPKSRITISLQSGKLSAKDRWDWLPVAAVPSWGAPLQSPSPASDKNAIMLTSGLRPQPNSILRPNCGPGSGFFAHLSLIAKTSISRAMLHPVEGGLNRMESGFNSF